MRILELGKLVAAMHASKFHEPRQIHSSRAALGLDYNFTTSLKTERPSLLIFPFSQLDLIHLKSFHLNFRSFNTPLYI